MHKNRHNKGGDAGRTAAGADTDSPVKTVLGKLIAKLLPRRRSMGRTANGRRYPDLIKIAEKPARPISFVVIRFSDEYYHNFLQSESAHDSLNEVIEIDNTSNLHYDNLSRAIIAGLDKAQNDIIAVIHEDVLLPDGWQSQFEHSLRQLEVHDPAWGMLGSVGWNSDGAFIGHWSDPHQFKNTFEGSGFNFQEAEKLDEQLLIMHRARKPNLDGNLPGIHFLGEDLKHDLSSHGLRCYAVNAPTIHKYADRTGEIIVSSAQSDKIGDRESATYLADEACCKDYVRWKHPNFFPQTDTIPSVPALDKDKILQLERPVIVVCKGEAESELLRGLLAGIGVYSGSSRLEADEFQELMIPVYKMVIEKFRCHASWQKSHTASSLQSVAAHMIRDLPPSQPWGFVFPESILVLPELRDVFPNARYVYFQRDPLSICTGAVARSARLDNHIGRISLPEAYRYLGIDVAQITTDDAVDHMISTTVHHLELVRQHFAEVANSVQLTVSFEVLVQDPESTMERLSTWLGDQGSRQAMQPIHIDAAMKPLGAVYSAQRIEAAADRLAVIRAALGYI